MLLDFRVATDGSLPSPYRVFTRQTHYAAHISSKDLRYTHAPPNVLRAEAVSAEASTDTLLSPSSERASSSLRLCTQILGAHQLLDSAREVLSQSIAVSGSSTPPSQWPPPPASQKPQTPPPRPCFPSTGRYYGNQDSSQTTTSANTHGGGREMRSTSTRRRKTRGECRSWCRRA